MKQPREQPSPLTPREQRLAADLIDVALEAERHVAVESGRAVDAKQCLDRAKAVYCRELDAALGCGAEERIHRYTMAIAAIVQAQALDRLASCERGMYFDVRIQEATR